MAHISYSALKDWAFCAFYHKLTRVDKIDGFKGNVYTAFGNAMHGVCEKLLLKEKMEDDFFLEEFKKYVDKLPEDVDVDSKLEHEMKAQGLSILPEIQDALDEYFGEDYEVMAVEMPLNEPIEGEDELTFKGYIDAVVATKDGKIHIFDWKTCSWGWDARKRSDKLITYQLTLYKHFFAKKMGVDPKDIETHFALLKRTLKTNRVEFFRVTSGPQKTKNVLKLLNTAVYNIKNKRYIKNRLSCTKGYGCKFYKSVHCQ